MRFCTESLDERGQYTVACYRERGRERGGEENAVTHSFYGEDRRMHEIDRSVEKSEQCKFLMQYCDLGYDRKNNVEIACGEQNKERSLSAITESRESIALIRDGTVVRTRSFQNDDARTRE